MYRRPPRVEVRLGNVLEPVSGEICSPTVLAEGTGSHTLVAQAREDETQRVVRRR